MEKVLIDLKNCYGIKALKTNLDFSETAAYAIYAPNGVMKSSLAQTFLDAANGEKSKDRIFPAHKTERSIVDEKGDQIEGRRVLVVVPYDPDIGPGAECSVLLVNAKLRDEYTKLFVDINATKADLLNAIRLQAKSEDANFENEVASAFTSGDDIYVALGRIKEEVKKQKDAPFKDVEYDKIFNEQVTSALATKNLKDAIENYIQRYNELLDNSVFFKKGKFDYYNAGQIADSLTKNGFFDAKHTVSLKSSGKTVEINTEAELEKIIEDEKQSIIKDKKLLATFDDISKRLNRNAALREFCRYIQVNPALVARMSNVDKLREDILKSYLKANEQLFTELLSRYEAALKRKEQIEEIARLERTQWDRVISIFNSRFVVPFELEVRNRFDVMMGTDGAPDLGFTYKDGNESAKIERVKLLEVLSNGEKKALYILSVLFEVETRKSESLETFVVVDDLADSFDYQNKYAIIQYLKDISADGLFKLIIMTHNFDFFRTIANGFVGYGHSLMASKNDKGTTLVAASGINNPFANIWKKGFFTDQKQKIASVSFLRNLIEMTVGITDPDYMKLTSLLHWKEDTSVIKVGDLDKIFNRLCHTDDKSKNADKLVHELIDEEANKCAAETDGGMKLENKIVLSIATRLVAERFMIKKLNDDAFWKKIKKNQTTELKKAFEKKFSGETETIAVLDRVALMTPENIHLNSFMFEPLIDMSDDHLRRLYADVKALS